MSVRKEQHSYLEQSFGYEEAQGESQKVPRSPGKGIKGRRQLHEAHIPQFLRLRFNSL